MTMTTSQSAANPAIQKKEINTHIWFAGTNCELFVTEARALRLKEIGEKVVRFTEALENQVIPSVGEIIRAVSNP